MADSKNLEFLKQLNDLQNELNIKMRSTIDFNEKIKIQEELIANQKRIQAENDRLIIESKNKNITLSRAEKKEINDIIIAQKAINTELSKEKNWRDRIAFIGKESANQIKIGWGYLQQQDKTIKSTILNLGLSGTKANLMRLSFEESAGYVARLGGNLEDVQTIMTGFADETGRARVLSAQMIQDVTAIGRGTGLGVEQATRLAAQFEFMGVDVKATMNYVQGVIDTSERMGVNTTKVLKAVNDNFKKLSTFTFQAGVKAYGQMAMDAERTRVSMSTALDVAEATRGLESVIELGANLQVMGGEFAKMDPLRWLYMVRNEPEKINEEISKMTTGIYTLRKNSEGLFEKFISPADRDRLTSVAKSLGISNEKIFEIAQRRHDLSLMENEMAGMGLNPREKELIQGAAQFNSESGKHQVRLAGTMQDISTLTKQQANAFAKEQVLLKDRAREALTFDEVFKATINELKATLLPLLNTINKTLVTFKKASDYVVDKFKTLGPFLSGAGLITAAISLKAAGMFINTSLSNLVSRGSLFKGKTGAVDTRTGSQAFGQGKGAGLAARGAGMKALGTGAGIGAAGLGVGAGIGAAAGGISLLADSMSKLNKDQAETLKSIVNSISIAASVGVVAAVALIALGKAGAISAGGLGALALPILGIGAGIGVATAGIGFMAEGLGNMIDKSKDAGPAMLQVGAGIGALSLAMMGFTAGGLGLLVFAGTMATIAKHAPSLASVGDAFREINAVMSGNKEDWTAIQNAIEGISKANIKGGGVLGELAALLKEPLKVQFADNDVQLRSNVTLDIDKTTFMNKIFDAKIAVQMINDLKK